MGLTSGLAVRDPVEGRIRTDSGGFRAAPQGIFWRYCTICKGILTLQKWVPDSDGFGRESDSDGFQDPKYGSRQPSLTLTLGLRQRFPQTVPKPSSNLDECKALTDGSMNNTGFELKYEVGPSEYCLAPFFT